MSVDLSSQEFWALTPEEREPVFARLRAQEPISWQPQPEGSLMPAQEGSGGYWAVVRYDDVRAVSRDPGTYRSGQGVMFEDIPPLLVVGEAMGVLHSKASEIAADRRLNPRDDVISALVHAEIDGESLTDFEIAAFFVLLSVAGNDTTRHTTSHAVLALSRNPDQQRVLLDDLEGTVETAVEEFVRWASPVISFRRTAARDTELAGQAIAEGNKVVIFYCSANRDEDAFEAPGRFDVTRDPNRHVGFGGGGPHFCMGAVLARAQLRSLFTELLRAYPELEVGEPKHLAGNFVSGISRLPMTLGPRAN